jgi:hypothetical protein
MSAQSGVNVSAGRQVSLAALAFVVVCLPLAGPSYAQAPQAAAPGSSAEAASSKLPEIQRLGDETSGYVYRMGWEELKPKLAGTQALAAIEDPQVQVFFEAFKAVGQRQHPSSPFFRFVLSGLHDQLVMATRPIPGASNKATEEEEEKGKPNQLDTQEMAVISPGPQGKAQFEQLYADAIKAWGEDTGTKAEQAKIGPVSFDVLGEAKTGIHTALHDGRCYWAVGAGAAGWAADSSRPAKSLDRSELFQNTVGPLFKGQSQQPIALYYYDLRPGWKKIDGVDPQGAWKQISWHSLDAVAGAAFVEKDHYRNRHYWRVGPERHGLFEHSRGAKIKEEWLKRVPAECSGFTTGVYDAYSLLAFLPTVFMHLFGADDSTIVQTPTMMMSFRPMLQQLGPRYLIYRMPGRYGSFPIADIFPLSNAVVLSEVRDPAAFAQALESFAIGPVKSQTATVLGRKVVSVNIMYFTVYFALLEKEAIITMNPQLLKDAIEAAGQPGPSVIETPAYKEAQAHRLPDACFMLYMPPGGFSRGIYDQYIPMLQQTIALVGAFQGGFGANAANAAPGMDPIVFPRGSDIARHAKQATILSAVDDGQGVLFDGVAPILSTPYYWAYVHAMTRLRPADSAYPTLMLAVVPFLPAPK